VAEAATIVHRGPMDDVLGTLAVLAKWIEHSGRLHGGAPREVYLSTGADESLWVTELQQPLSSRAG
jgi:effector-binding domain-containing protein